MLNMALPTRGQVPGSTHQSAGTRHGDPWAPAPFAHQHANTISEILWTPRPATLGSNPIHQGDNTSSGPPKNMQLAISGTRPTHQQCDTICRNANSATMHPQNLVLPTGEPAQAQGTAIVTQPCQPLAISLHARQGLTDNQTEALSKLPACL